MTIEDIAMMAHDANRVLCFKLRDATEGDWYFIGHQQRESYIKGVQWRLDHPHALPADQRNEWMRCKLQDGWKLGPTKDISKKESPCLIPYSDLPKEQRAKDALFVGIVTALAPLLD